MIEELEKIKCGLRSWFISSGGIYRADFENCYATVSQVVMKGFMSSMDFRVIVEHSPDLARAWCEEQVCSPINYIKRLKQVPCTQIDELTELIKKGND